MDENSAVKVEARELADRFGLREKTPKAGTPWRRILAPPREHGVLSRSAWVLGGQIVISDLVEAELPNGSGDAGLQWHLSVSDNLSRPCDRDVLRVRMTFDMREAEEDNHHPGVARHLFLVVDPADRIACECKATEIQRVEPDGYRWSDDPSACRGCDLERRTGRACPRHPR
jgi:hypothetical protein